MAGSPKKRARKLAKATVEATDDLSRAKADRERAKLAQVTTSAAVRAQMEAIVIADEIQRLSVNIAKALRKYEELADDISSPIEALKAADMLSKVLERTTGLHGDAVPLQDTVFEWAPYEPETREEGN